MSHCWCASIELAVWQPVCFEQRNTSRWSASWCALLKCCNSHFRDRAVCCRFSPFYSSHWATSLLISSMLSQQDGSFLPGGTQNPGILLLSLEVTFTRDQHNSCSWPLLCWSELPASVIWGTQMHCSALLRSVGDTCRSGETLPCKRCRVKELGDLPAAAAARGRVMLSSDCSYSLCFYGSQAYMAFLTDQIHSWALDTIWIFFFLMFN